MHPNPAFRAEPVDNHVRFARSRSFGTLILNGPEGPLVSHIPFLLSSDGSEADLHLVRSNPIARVGEQAAMIAVQGADGYVSPDWYRADDQVPTWNYIAVHLRGVLTPLPTKCLRDVIDRQSAHFEQQLKPKQPWTSSKMTPQVLERMMRQILPFRLKIQKIEGTWKLNQNKPDEQRLAAAENIESGVGFELASLARLMREH